MEFKSLKIRYLVIFILSAILLFLLLDFYKKKEIKTFLGNYKNNIQKEYEKVFKTYQDLSELIYFNEFIKDEKTFEVLKNSKNLELEDLKKELYFNFVESFAFYRTLDLNNIYLYSNDANLILNFENTASNKFIPKIVENTLLDKKDRFEYKIVEDKVYLIFSKSIFDNELNFVGAVVLEFDFEDIIKKLVKNTSSEISYLLVDEIQNLLSENLFYLKIANLDAYKKFLLIEVSKNSENNKIENINSLFNQFYIISLFLIIIALFLLYKIIYLKLEKNISEKEYKEFFLQMDEYILSIDTDLKGDITFVSNAFCKASGYSKDELIGKNASILRHSDMSNIFFENLWKELKLNKFWQGEIKNKDKYGNTSWLKSTIFPRYNLKNQMIGFSSIRVDITDAKQLEKINRLLKDDLSSNLNEIKLKDESLMDRAKVLLMSKIIDSMSHQWKAPISKISLEIKNIENQEIKNSIDFELKELSDMLNDIKKIFIPRNSENTNLNKCVEDVVLSLEKDLKKYNITVKFTKESDVNLEISFNEFKNILINILKNIIQQVQINNMPQTNIFINTIFEANEDSFVLKIEDNIKKQNLKSVLDDILNSSDEKYQDTNIHLAKLFIEKNDGLFWYKNTQFDTIYYIKLKKYSN